MLRCRVGVFSIVAVVMTGLLLPGAISAPGAVVAARDQPTTASEPMSLCRYGVDALGSMEDYPVEDLRVGWYVDFGMNGGGGATDDLQYMPMIRLYQTTSGTYGLRGTDLATISARATAVPGQTWIVGNEPDSPVQDRLEPQAYAEAYHDLYAFIKSVDPTAKVATGAIIQPTPIRLLYLDMVLDSYHQMYGGPMPVDVWNIHVYILNEVSCDYDPDYCWGALIPPGIDLPYGEIMSFGDNANVELFKDLVRSFRAWMADRGYQDHPLIITEFGVQMPEWLEPGFPPSVVNAYMNETFDFLRTATGEHGYPADGGRLVQRWAWWSLQRPPDYDQNNGWLYDPGTPPVRTVFGDNYAAYTSQIQPAVDLLPVRIWADAGGAFSLHGEPVTVTLSATISNAGEVSCAGGAPARFYRGNPPDTSSQIGTDLIVASSPGCGNTQIVTATLTSVSPGVHPIYLVVDPDDMVGESNELNNTLMYALLVGTERVMLPLISR